MSVILLGPISLSFLLGWPIILGLVAAFSYGYLHLPEQYPFAIVLGVVCAFGEWYWWKSISREAPKK